MKDYLVKVDQDSSVIVVGNKEGTFSVRYIKRDGKFYCFDGEWENIPFVEGNLLNPYSQHSDKYETIEKVISEYNSIQGGLEDGELIYSFY